jgi:hypothetical protein
MMAAQQMANLMRSGSQMPHPAMLAAMQSLNNGPSASSSSATSTKNSAPAATANTSADQLSSPPCLDTSSSSVSEGNNVVVEGGELHLLNTSNTLSHRKHCRIKSTKHINSPAKRDGVFGSALINHSHRAPPPLLDKHL